jgi:hypothetical protein
MDPQSNQAIVPQSFSQFGNQIAKTMLAGATVGATDFGRSRFTRVFWA